MKMEQNMCRICLSDRKCFISIRDKFGEHFIWEVINDIADVSVSNSDEFPQMLCNVCYKRLTEAINFKEEIQQTERLLQGQQVYQEEEKMKVEYLLDDPEAVAAINDFDGDSNQEPVDDESVVDTIEEEQKVLILPPRNDTIRSNTGFECCLCESSFPDDRTCICHMNQHHMAALMDNLSFRDKFKTFRFFCSICQKGFRRKMSIDTHLSDKSFVEKAAKRTDAKNWRKPTQCQACGKFFSDKFGATYHYDRVHEKNKTIKCDQCDKLFATRKLLNRHAKAHGPRSLKCPECDKSFPQVSQLRSHMNTHLTVKKFKCDLCSKTFSNKRVLEIHILQHTEKKPFKCTQCPRMYKWPEDLQTHQRAIHEGIFPFFCSFCKKGFTSSSNRKYHERGCIERLGNKRHNFM